MDSQEIARRRLCSQLLAGARPADPVDVVGHFGAMQAQEFALARWSVGQRCTGADDAAVRRAVDNGQIVRLHALRPTWHFVAAADVGWIQAATGARVHAFNAFYYRQHGMDDAFVDRVCPLVVDLLRGGQHLTRAEIGAALAEEGIEATGNKLAYVIMRCELEGLVVNGPMRGRQHTYASLAERVAGAYTPEDGVAELTRRYFTSHGPATVKDFAWWSSLTVAQIRRSLSTLDLPWWDVDGRRYYDVDSADPPTSAGVQVLQIFDEYVVAYTESRAVMNVAGLDLGTVSRNALVHSILLDSQVIGVWRRTTDRGTLVVQPRVAVRLTGKLRRSVEAAFDRHAWFAGLGLRLEWDAF